MQNGEDYAGQYCIVKWDSKWEIQDNLGKGMDGRQKEETKINVLTEKFKFIMVNP